MPSVRNFIAPLFAICLFVQLSSVHGTSSRDVLWTMLSKCLIKDVAPGAHSEALVVKHSLTIQKVLDLSDGILTLHLWEEMYWQDSRIHWEPDMYSGIKQLSIPSRFVWQPDIILYNSVEDYNGFASGDLNAIISYDGNVSFIPPQTTKTSCYIAKDESHLEEDFVTSCTLKYGSWTRSADSLNLQLQSQPDMYNADSPDWHIVNATAKRNVIKYSCCPETYIDITYTLQLSKKK